MNNCPNCGKGISTGRAVCECGELLRADATQHLHPWETETVFRPAAKVKANHLATLSVILVVIASVMALAWPQLRERWNLDDQPVSKTENSKTEPVSTQSDVLTRSDLIEPDPETDSVTQEGVFDFTNGERTPQNAKPKNAVRSVRETATQPQTVTVSENSYDAQLLSDKTNTDPKQTDEKSSPDCKPETTASLKRPEPTTESETKPQPRSTAINYILGPRGGCFFVTAGGSKKYVDHSLCGTSNVAAARQD
jgi:hypothetical protein